jgi:hypothetical protein
MPIIKLPSPMAAVVDKNGDTTEPELTGAQTIRDAVLTLPFWKEGSDLKRVDAFLEIEDALDAAPNEPTVSTEARNFLKDAMQLRLPNGNFGTVNGTRQNRFYMRVLRAVLVASEKEPPK